MKIQKEKKFLRGGGVGGSDQRLGMGEVRGRGASGWGSGWM